ncbi:hypothetical protein [Streptomyces sp. NBC_01451]|uniref:hypothetical protein n=1 Tax=Streptomyces sp. NBC_01451 TaxID=2903872 RepID=UPI002E32C604|nr:hypothetical protein [Streptomyces sp. NBC_01451]
MQSHSQAGSIGVRLIMEAEGKKWARYFDLAFAPFPGMGVRVDTYEVLNVDKVLVDDLDGGVTCFAADDDGREFTAKKCVSLGFAEYDSADARAVQAAFPVRVSVITSVNGGMLSKTFTLPFPPFNGLHVQVNDGKLLKIFTVVVGDDHRSEVECYASFVGEGAENLTEEECEALGFEEDCR